MTVSAVSPWRTALRRDTCFPASVFGPVLLSALRRLASICLNEVMAICLAKWVRFVILTSAERGRLVPALLARARDEDVISATARVRRHAGRYRSFSTRSIHRHSDGPRGGVPGTAEP